jgi:hypothetical protein
MDDELAPSGCILILPKRPELLPPPFKRALKELLEDPEGGSGVVLIAPAEEEMPANRGQRQGGSPQRIPPVVVSGILLPIATKAANDLYDGVKTVVKDYYISEKDAKDYITNKYRLNEA